MSIVGKASQTETIQIKRCSCTISMTTYLLIMGKFWSGNMERSPEMYYIKAVVDVRYIESIASGLDHITGKARVTIQDL